MRLAGLLVGAAMYQINKKKVCGLLVHVIGGRLYIKKHDRHYLRLFPQSCGGDPIQQNETAEFLKMKYGHVLAWPGLACCCW